MLPKYLVKLDDLDKSITAMLEAMKEVADYEQSEEFVIAVEDERLLTKYAERFDWTLALFQEAMEQLTLPFKGALANSEEH
jgi:hypothetical protein